MKQQKEFYAIVQNGTNKFLAGYKKNETAQAAKQPVTENSNAEAGSQGDNTNQQGNATEFVKNGSDIQVTNPEVVIDQSNGTGKYQGFTVEYKRECCF